MPKVSQRATKMHPKIDLRTRSRKGEPKAPTGLYFWSDFWSVEGTLPPSPSAPPLPRVLTFNSCYCPRSGLLCRWALNSMFVRCLSVRLSVRHVFYPISSAVFTFSPLFRSVKSLKHFAKCFRFGLLLGENNPKTNQNPTHFAKC